MIRSKGLRQSEGGANWPSLLVSAAALSLLAGSLFLGPQYAWCGIALLVLAVRSGSALFPTGYLAAVMVPFCGWLFVDAAYVTPMYYSYSLYRPLILLAAFLALAIAGRPQAERLFRIGLALLSMLVLMGMLQLFGGFWHLEQNPQRAAATFATPNTFATAINLFLLPLAALYLTSHGTRTVLALVLWLFAGLVATESRGGMLAFVAGLGFIGVCAGPSWLWSRRARIASMLGGALAVAGVVSLGRALGPGAAMAELPVWAERGVADRPDYYAAALRMILDHPFLGTGANTFFPLYEIVKPELMRDRAITFVHNDYLQHWLEFGAPGILLLLLLAIGSLVLALRAWRRDPREALPLACGAALAACFAHAVVDFPLYIPFIVLVVGSHLGVLAAHLGALRAPALDWQWTRRFCATATPRIRWTLAIAALAWIAQPALADLASRRSVATLAGGNARDALYWLSVARRLEPRLPAHYWAEGMIWQGQAVESKNPALAARAEELFVAGSNASPYDVANLLARVSLHRQHPELASASSPAEVLSWSARAASLRPQLLTIQGEYARTLAYAGQVEQARALARRLLVEFPEAEFARRLAAEL